MGGEFTYQPQWDPKTVLTPTAISFGRSSSAPGLRSARFGRGAWPRRGRPSRSARPFGSPAARRAAGPARWPCSSPETSARVLGRSGSRVWGVPEGSSRVGASGQGRLAFWFGSGVALVWDGRETWVR